VFGNQQESEHPLRIAHSITTTVELVIVCESYYLVNAGRNTRNDAKRTAMGVTGGPKLGRRQPANTPSQILQKFPVAALQQR